MKLIGKFGLSALGALLAASTAQAANECGAATGTPATATCTIAGNPFPDGIIYQIDNGDLIVNLDPGVVIETTILGDAAGVTAQTNVTGSVFVNAPAATISLINDPAATFRYGIRATSAAGDVFVDSGGNIAVPA